MAAAPVLVFDVDGTLAETERDGHRVAFNRAFEEAGLDWHWTIELYGKLLAVTGGKERMQHYLDQYNTGFDRPDDLAEFIAGLHRAKTRHYVAMLKEGAIPLRPGVALLIDQARQAGWRMSIATTTTPENVTALLNSTFPAGAIDWFEVIGAGDIVPNKKPAPDIYDWVIEHMGITPTQVIAFEDSENGLRSAIAAGIQDVVITVNDYTVQQNFSAASVELDSLGDDREPARCRRGLAPPNGVVDLSYLKAIWSKLD